MYSIIVNRESVSHSLMFDSFVTPWTIVLQAPLTTGFSGQKYWSELPFPPEEIFPTQGLNPGLPNCRQILYQLSHKGSPCVRTIYQH